MNKAMGHKVQLQGILNLDVEWALPDLWRKETSCTEDGTRRKGPSSQALEAGAGAGVLRGSEGIVGRRPSSIVHLGGVGPSSILIWE